jgi:hypothetical protein
VLREFNCLLAIGVRTMKRTTSPDAVVCVTMMEHHHGKVLSKIGQLKEGERGGMEDAAAVGRKAKTSTASFQLEQYE